MISGNERKREKKNYTKILNFRRDGRILFMKETVGIMSTNNNGIINV